jgi:hypothetical protein
VCPEQHRTGSGPEGLSSAQALWWARLPVEARLADHYVAVRQPEERLRVAGLRDAQSARAEACRRPSRAEQQSAAQAVWDARVLPAEAAAECETAQRPAGAAVPLAQPVAAAEHVAEVAAAGAQHVGAAAVAGAQHVGAAAVPRVAAVREVAAVQAVPQAGVAEELVSLRAAVARRAWPDRVAARPSAAPSAFHPGQLRPEPARQRAAGSRHAMARSTIASL